MKAVRLKLEAKPESCGADDSSSVPSDFFEMSREMQEIKEVLWSIEEVVYMNTVEEDEMNASIDIVLKRLSAVAGNFHSESEVLGAEFEKKNVTSIIEQYCLFFEALKLAKQLDYEKCINHKALSPYFNFLLNLFKNRSVKTIHDVGGECFKYIENKRKELFECKHTFVTHLLAASLLQFKLLLCVFVLLSIFVQQNCTGPVFDLEEPIDGKVLETDAANVENGICFKTFVHILSEENPCYLQSCFELLSLEGEYVYENCQLLNCFCLTILLLDIINNYEKNDFSLFEDHEIHLCKNYEPKEFITCVGFFAGALQMYVSQKNEGCEMKPTVCSLYYLKSRFLWIARVYFIWQRLFTSNSIYYHFLRMQVLEKPLHILAHLKIVPDEVRPKDINECEKLEEYVPIVNVFSKVDPQFWKMFYASSISNRFKINVLSNYTMYLAYYNDVHAYKVVTQQMSLFSTFQWNFTGRMGIRRKYQRHPVPLLVLKTSADGIEDETDSVYVDVCPSSIYDILKSKCSVLEIERDCEKDTPANTAETTDGGKITGVTTGVTTGDTTGDTTRDTTGDTTGDAAGDITTVTGANTNGDAFALNPSPLESNPEKRKTWKLKELDPDTDILEEPFFLDSQNNRFRVLNFKEQIILINKCYSYTQFFPEYDPITFEEMSALTSRCLKAYDVSIKELGSNKIHSGSIKPGEKINEHEEHQGREKYVSLQKRFQNWLLHSCLLLFKSKVEFTRYRTKERANFQLNELIKEYTEKKPNGFERMRFAYDVYYPFQWNLKKQVGKRMVDSGHMMTAFHIYKSLKLWEDAVNCLIAVGRDGEALELLDEISEGNRTPCIVCLYGMANRKNSHIFYEESWKLSNEKYAKAARLLGTYYYNANEYEKCCHYFEKALEISPLYPDVYFMLGCAYMKREQYTGAIKAFTRMVTMPNAECHKAWGNLAFIYINLNKFESAKICITHAIKLDFNNWKYWDTFAKVAVCQQDVENSCLALKELCELGKAKFIDPVVFHFFLNVIINREQIEIFKRKECIDRITKAMKTASGYIGVNIEFWKIYFILTAELGDHNEALNLCIRSLRSVQATLESVNNEETRKELLKQHCKDIVLVFTEMLSNVMDAGKRLSLLNELSSVVNEFFPNTRYPVEPFLKDLEEMRQRLENLKTEQTVS